MKVLKNNYHEVYDNTTKIDIEPYPRTVECDGCGSELEYEKSDMEVGVYGAMHVKCPLCGYNNMLDGNECDVTLTKDNIEFPLHFSYSSKETGAVDTCNNEHIKKEINNAITYLRNNKDGDYWFTTYGNLYILVQRFDGDNEYDIMVTDKHWETYIPFEPEDY